MDVILDQGGAVVAAGGEGLTPTAGQTALATDLTLDDFKAADAAGAASGQPYDVTCDGKAFAVRTRAANAAEQAMTKRAQLVAQIDAAVAAWPTATAAQKDAALFALLQLVQRLAHGG